MTASYTTPLGVVVPGITLGVFRARDASNIGRGGASLAFPQKTAGRSRETRGDPMGPKLDGDFSGQFN